MRLSTLAHMAAGWLGRWLRCSMLIWQWVDKQQTELQHDPVAMWWEGKWLKCSKLTWQWGGWASG